MAEVVQLKTLNDEEVYPQTLMSLAIRENGELLEELILAKDNTTSYTPTQDYHPATKKYVDTKQKIKMVISIRKPSGMNVGDFWYQLPSHQYTWSEVDSFNYTFNDVNAQNLTWAEADLGGW